MQEKIKFDSKKHQPPRIDFFGYNIDTNKKNIQDGGYNILTQQVKIPDWWSKPGVKDEDKKTLTKLKEERNEQRRPHISYDLDGDGYVGGRDYVIAK